jgi:hypothetical protein
MSANGVSASSCSASNSRNPLAALVADPDGPAALVDLIGYVLRSLAVLRVADLLQPIDVFTVE